MPVVKLRCSAWLRTAPSTRLASKRPRMDLALLLVFGYLRQPQGGMAPARDKALVLEQFLPVAAVDPTFFVGHSLHLVPDGLAAQHPYGVLVAALQLAAKGALGQVVLSTQRQLVLVRPAGRLLVLDVLH